MGCSDCSLEAMISACHADDPGSNPGSRTILILVTVASVTSIPPPCGGRFGVAEAWIDDLAFPLSLVTYDKRFSGGLGAVGRRVDFSLIIGYLL